MDLGKRSQGPGRGGAHSHPCVDSQGGQPKSTARLAQSTTQPRPATERSRSPRGHGAGDCSFLTLPGGGNKTGRRAPQGAGSGNLGLRAGLKGGVTESLLQWPRGDFWPRKIEQSSLLLPPKDNCVRERAGQHSRAGGWGQGRGPGPETPGRRTRDRTWQRKAAWAPRVQTPAQQRQEAGAAVRVQRSAPSCRRATQVCARESSLPGDSKEQLKSRLPK